MSAEYGQSEESIVTATGVPSSIVFVFGQIDGLDITSSVPFQWNQIGAQRGVPSLQV
jgi:hypothetical protein